MHDPIRPAHSCDRCRGGMIQHVRRPEPEDPIDLCTRCHHVQGNPLSPLDHMVSALWSLHDRTGSPRPEDIHSVARTGHAPPETYEIQEMSPMELNSRIDRCHRLHESFCRIEREAAGQADEPYVVPYPMPLPHPPPPPPEELRRRGHWP